MRFYLCFRCIEDAALIHNLDHTFKVAGAGSDEGSDDEAGDVGAL